MAELRSGFTTGTCAAAAAKAAVSFLLDGRPLTAVEVPLPAGERVVIPLVRVGRTPAGATAVVRKDAGDDPDITDGLPVVAEVAGIAGNEVVVAAGEGVGTVTKPGLSVAPGEAAINPVPRRMIRAAVREVTDRGIKVTISIPGGREAARKTFNPRLGITGGLSILGTSGRVRPFSCAALRTSLQCLLDVVAASGIKAPVLVPGHIGRRAAARHFHLAAGQIVEVGNEWGFTLTGAAGKFAALLVLGHPGKLAKLAMGEENTHSSRSRSAVPYVANLAAGILGRVGPELPTVEGIFSACAAPERQRLGDILAERIHNAVRRRTEGMETAVVLVDMQGEIIGSNGDLRRWK